MQSRGFFVSYIISLVLQSPLFLVYGCGFVLGLAWRRKYPRAALLTILSTAVLFLNGLIFTGVQTWLPLYLNRVGMYRDMQTIMSIVAVVKNLIEAVAIGGILLAVFNKRAPEPEKAKPSSSGFSGFVQGSANQT
jgi:hypothetical protein